MALFTRFWTSTGGLQAELVPAKESEDGNSEAEELLPVSDRPCGEKASGGPLDGVLEEGGSFQVRLDVDDVV